MVDDARLGPLTLALYSGLQVDLDLAKFVAERLASEWRVPIAVVGAGYADFDKAQLYAMFDLSTEGGDDRRPIAFYVAEP